MAQQRRHFGWEFFPFYLIAAMLLVVAVNTKFIYAALSTFPGEAGSNDFDLSNRYNAVLDLAAQQAAMGWHIDAQAAAGQVVVHLKTKNTIALADATLTATAMRPLGADHAQTLQFRQTAPGVYAAPIILAAGQWDVMLHITHGDQTMRITKRIIAP